MWNEMNPNVSKYWQHQSIYLEQMREQRQYDRLSEMLCTVGFHSVNAPVERHNEEGVNTTRRKIGVEEQRKGHYRQSNYTLTPIASAQV